jgi:hypothetical protein
MLAEASDRVVSCLVQENVATLYVKEMRLLNYVRPCLVGMIIN